MLKILKAAVKVECALAVCAPHISEIEIQNRS